MIIDKLLSTIVVVFVHSVYANPQFDLAKGLLNTAIARVQPSIDSTSSLTNIVANAIANKTSDLSRIDGGIASGWAKVAVNSAQRIAESLKGLIGNFIDFKTIFNKRYASVAEEKLREQMFKVNLATILDHNELFKKGMSTFSLAMNFFGDWTRDEYRKILGVDLSKAPNVTGNDDTSKNMRHRRQSSRAVDGCKFPVAKDWRKDGAVSPVKHQYKCGSCWAFASTGAFESHYFLKHGKLPNFSEQQLVDCAESEGKGCDGSFMYAAYEYVIKNGIVTNETYPYRAKESGAQNKCNQLHSNIKIITFQAIDQNEAALKDAVCRYGPLAIVIDASSENFWLYHGGIYRDPVCSTHPNDGNHAMLLVGYGVDSETDEPYWLVKNSYGTSWGENGYVRIPRDENNSCGIANLASYPIF